MQAQEAKQRVKHGVLIDIDGVLADNWHRIPHIHDNKDDPDWDTFYSEASNDPPIKGWVALTRILFESSHTVILLTNRPEWTRRATMTWLRNHRIPYDMLLMRDGAHYNDSKRQHVQELERDGWTFAFAVDDDPHHAEMYTELNIPFLYAHSGYYDSGRVSDEKIV